MCRSAGPRHCLLIIAADTYSVLQTCCVAIADHAFNAPHLGKCSIKPPQVPAVL